MGVSAGSFEVTEPRQYPRSLQRHAQESIAEELRKGFDTLPNIRSVARGSHSLEAWVSAVSKDMNSTNIADVVLVQTATKAPAPSAPPTRAPQAIPNGKPPGSMETSHSVGSADQKHAISQNVDMKNIVRKRLNAYVGFANLPNQWHRKSVRKGFNFNVMVVGM